ncbi:MAG: AAA family ATPase, partial [Actinomycetes bacterium]
MTGPSEEAATGQSDQAQEPAAELFSEERTDSTPHPNSDAFEVQPTQVVASPNPNSGPYATPQPAAQPGYPAGQYDQNLPPLQPQQPYAGYPQPGQAPLQPQPGQAPAVPGQPQAGPGPGPGPGPGLPQPGGRPGATGPDDLATAHLVKQAKRTPQSGWRKALYLGTGKLVNPGESPADRRRRELIARVNQPLRGCYKIAMLSLKGGVGKTTVTATVGATFASLRGDRVIAVDANPDRGTLSQKIPLETSATVRHLLRDAQTVRRYNDVRAYTSQGPSRLEVLASEQDPAVSEAFSEAEYRRTVALLEHFYNVVLTDCGTGLMHSAMYGVL